MTALFRAATAYLILGLASGLYYREFTKANDFAAGEFTQLSATHTHLLALGFMMFLIFLALEKVFAISHSRKLFTWFFWLYNAGVLTTVAMMVWHGSLTVLGRESNAMIAGIAGIGHILITAGLIVFIIALRRAISAPLTAAPAGSGTAVSA